MDPANLTPEQLRILGNAIGEPIAHVLRDFLEGLVPSLGTLSRAERFKLLVLDFGRTIGHALK
jgi:hypothetical protein